MCTDSQRPVCESNSFYLIRVRHRGTRRINSCPFGALRHHRHAVTAPKEMVSKSKTFVDKSGDQLKSLSLSLTHTCCASMFGEAPSNVSRFTGEIQSQKETTTTRHNSQRMKEGRKKSSLRGEGKKKRDCNLIY